MGAPHIMTAGVFLSVLALATVAPAETPAPGTHAATTNLQDAAPAAPATVVSPVRRASPMMLQVRAALDREREQVEALRARLLTTTDHQQALALQREIEKVKLDTEVAVLRIQADAARKAGRTALAEHLEAAATNLLIPPTAVTTVARPTPRGSSR